MSPTMTQPVATATHRIPSLPREARQTYEGLRMTGAASPNAARNVTWLSKQLRVSKHALEDRLRLLEGKGVVNHIQTGRETLWYTCK